MSSPKGVNALIQRRIEIRDTRTLNPSERADLVNTFIFHSLGLTSPQDVVKNPLFWDLVCFACEFMNLTAKTLDDPLFLELQKQVNGFIYQMHYSLPEGDDAINLSKEDHRKIWETRSQVAIDTHPLEGFEGNEAN